MADKSDVLETLKHSNLFLTGGAGVGKSYITNEVISDYRKRGKQVVALGSTGVSQHRRFYGAQFFCLWYRFEL